MMHPMKNTGNSTGKFPNTDLVRYELLPENAGRSRIRNILAHKAHYNWLIIMDCDSATPDELYLKRYLEQTNGDAVVCGGRTYLEEAPVDDTFLHWRYGTKREVRECGPKKPKPSPVIHDQQFYGAQKHH
jgi:hypothetical protein